MVQCSRGLGGGIRLAGCFVNEVWRGWAVECGNMAVDKFYRYFALNSDSNNTSTSG